MPFLAGNNRQGTALSYPFMGQWRDRIPGCAYLVDTHAPPCAAGPLTRAMDGQLAMGEYRMLYCKGCIKHIGIAVKI